MQPFVQQKIQEVSEDRHSGAAAITRHCVEAFDELIRQGPSDDTWDQLQQMGLGFIEAHPAMTSIVNAVDHILGTTHQKNHDQLLNAIRDYKTQLENSTERLVKCGLQLLNDGDRVFTHSASSSVLGLLEAKSDLSIILTESLPGGEGHRLAEKLGERATLISDMEAIRYMVDCDKVIVGADSLTDDIFVNKVGTYLIALAAKELGKPFFVITETLKYIPSGRKHAFRQKGHPLAAIYSNGADPLFEEIPLALVSVLITELGELTTVDPLREEYSQKPHYF